MRYMLSDLRPLILFLMRPRILWRGNLYSETRVIYPPIRSNRVYSSAMGF